MSELSGRLKPIIIGMIGFSIFTIGAATAKDFQTLMLTRYFAGCFAASVLTVAPACLADMYNNRERGLAVAPFAMGVFLGPFASPFVGGFIVDSYLGWRWTMYISSIMGFLGIGLLVFYRETYPPAILVAKAGRLRRQTHDWRIHAKQEEVEVDFKELLTTNFTRPMRMLVTEPIVLLVTIYMSFIYGLMYAFLGAYPLVFGRVHGMNEGVGGLPFIGLVIGQLFAGIYIMLIQPGYLKKLDENNGVPIPEWRLPPVIVGASAFAIGLFW
jgi:DHA1 family multidrug resistance protein-like MFS transporter